MGSVLRMIPFIKRTRERWSIGIYTGKDPFNLDSPRSNPVLTCADITDVIASSVADPFMVYENEIWYMFFEVYNILSGRASIGFATSKDTSYWKYEQIVLDEPFHLSYPYVFRWDHEYYMIPESRAASSVRLYKAMDFPKKWVAVRNLLEGDYADPSILYHNGKWWLFALRGHDELTLHYSDNLEGRWYAHPKSPLITGNKHISRPGGRMIVFDDRIIRYTQDDEPTYGHQLRAFEIDVLTTTDYQEHEIAQTPVLKASGHGWNADGMHNIDSYRLSENRWIACVDGVCRK